MRPVTGAFLEAVTRSHTMTARARVVPAGSTGTDPDGEEVPILEGNVELDGSAEVRGTLDLTTHGRFPTAAGDTFAPFGNELYVERGLKYGNGVTEWVGLGYYRLGAVEQPNARPAGELRLGAADRMAGLRDARLLTPIPYSGVATLGGIFNALVGDVYPGAVIEWDDDTETDYLGRSLVVERDRWKFLNELVTSRGKTWAWDHRGHLIIRDLPDPAEPVLELAGGAGGVMLEAARELTREGTYNAVVAEGDAPDDAAPVRAVVVDADPTSPTYFDGPFGPVPRFYSSPMITTYQQAAKAARGMLGRALGLPHALDLAAVPNPALEPLDPVSVVVPGEQPATHVLDQLTIPLTPEGTLEGTTVEQTTRLLEER